MPSFVPVLWCLPAALLFVWFSVKRKVLNLGGALAAAGIGLWVTGFAGMFWLIPLFWFFVTGSLLGRLNKTATDSGDAKAQKPRDHVQVLCNGGVYAALATFATGEYGPIALSGMLVSLSVSCSDTWSSEIGVFRRGPTLDVLRFRPVPPGLSGGVSLAGTLGGLAGALSVAAFAAVAIPSIPAWPVAILGFAGMLADSALGSGLQAKYRRSDGSLSDSPGAGRVLAGGSARVTNDGVNLLSNVLTTACWLFFYIK